MRSIICSLLFCLVLAGSACAAPISSVVATVNGEMISSRELDKAIEPQLVMSRLDARNPADAQRVLEIRREALDAMITEKILMQEAERQGITVTDEMVEDEVGRIIAESGMPPDLFAREAASQGLGMEVMRARIRGNITTQMLIGRQVMNKVVVTEKDISDYFHESGGHVPAPPPPPAPLVQPADPEPQYEVTLRRVRFGLIIYPSGVDAEKLAQDILSGTSSFESVARRVSEGPNAEGGGDLGMINAADLAPGLKEIAQVLEKGQITPLLDMGPAKAQLKLIDVVVSRREIPQPRVETPPPPPPAPPVRTDFDVLDAEATARIEEHLRRPLLEARFEEYTKQLRDRAIVDIKL